MTATTTPRTDYDSLPDWTLADCKYWFRKYGWGLVLDSAAEYHHEYGDYDYTGYLQDCIFDIVAHFGAATYADGRVDRP